MALAAFQICLLDVMWWVSFTEQPHDFKIPLVVKDGQIMGNRQGLPFFSEILF